MRSALLSIVLLSHTLTAQTAAPTAKLNETLRGLARPGASSVTLSAQLVDEMTSLAPADRQPSRGALAGFANVFVAALIGKDLTEARITTLQVCITEILSGDGTNFKPAKLLRDTLTAVGVPDTRTQSIITRFIAVGEEIRGPDDSPVLDRLLK
jgi:hypothetical protein